MVRPTWSGSVSFGLVSVPVELYTAVRTHTIRFRQLHRDTQAPVRQKRVDARTGDEVPYRDIVKGYEVDDGQYVVVEPEELERLDPEASRLISIQAYVEQREIDPVYYDRAYYLAPKGEIAQKPYRLLAEAMERTEQVAIATFVMRNREYLAAMRAHDGVLVLSTMHYPDEVATPADLDLDLGDGAEPSRNEISMAEQLIESMRTTFDPAEYRDHHHERILEYLRAKGEGRPIDLGAEHVERGNVIDLVSALEQSLSRAREGASPSAETTRSPGPDYGEMTRSELYELARRRDVPGRSSLTKAELVEALRRTDQQQPDVA